MDETLTLSRPISIYLTAFARVISDLFSPAALAVPA